MKVCFGICADLHAEFIHDSVERMTAFVNECEEKNVDFCIELGDFCPPGETNKEHKEKILSMLNNCSFPFYHTFGNHDEDQNTKEAVSSNLGLYKTNVSFDVGGIHFITLDACYYMQDNKYCSYSMGNYKNLPSTAYISVLPPHELERLKNELNQTPYPTVIFSHQSLIESRSGIQNAPAFRNVIQNSNSKVLMAICGHEHVDRLQKKDGIYYYCLNSMSYYWAGGDYTHTTFGEKIEKKYPYMKCVFPYKEPLYAIIEIDDYKIKIYGKNSEIIGEKPETMNFTKEGLTDRVTASVKSRTLNL